MVSFISRLAMCALSVRIESTSTQGQTTYKGKPLQPFIAILYTNAILLDTSAYITLTETKTTPNSAMCLPSALKEAVVGEEDGYDDLATLFTISLSDTQFQISAC
jgi:hypothetical protein